MHSYIQGLTYLALKVYAVQLMMVCMLKMRAVLVLQLLTCTQAGSRNYISGVAANFDGDDTGPYMDAFENVTWSNGDLRLVGNDSTSLAGRVEMFTVTRYNATGGEDPEGEWGTVCGDTFSMREADVACRQLGYQGASNWTFAINTEFGSANVSVPILLSGLQCSSLHQLHTLRCRHREIGSTSGCEHEQDVAIFCESERLWDQPYKGQVRLVSNTTFLSSSGRVEVRQGGEWGTVCGRDFTEAAADSVCRQLGYTGSSSIMEAPSSGSGVIWVGDTTCNTSQACFTSCFKAHNPTHRCNHTEDVAVQCTFNVSNARANPAGSRSMCRIQGFPIVLLTVVVILGLSTLTVLGCTVVVIITVTRCFRKVWMSRKYEELS